MARSTNKITKQSLKNIRPGEILWDSQLRGFGARCQKEGVSFIFKCSFRGRPRWITIGRMGQPWTLESARAEILRRLVAMNDGVDPRKPARTNSLTIRDAFEQYFAEHGPKLKRRTLEEYQRLAHKDIIPALGKSYLDEDHAASIRRFHTKLADTPRKANHALMLLSGLFTWAGQAGLRPDAKNPCSGVKKFREVKRERFLSAEEYQRLGTVLAACAADGTENIYALAAIRLLIFTGARRNEILTLRWSYFDGERACLHLPDSKTGAKIIRLSSPAVAELKSIPRIVGNDYVIVGDKEGSHLVSLQPLWSRIRKAADIEDVRLHDLRHSFASIAAEQGASLRVIGELLGHTDIQTTDRYAHLTERSIDDANNYVGNEIANVLGTTRPSALSPD